ncbi:MAG: DUF2157 domain-containing protein [Acidobacteria bacterium]|nr:DUF2157 domain-containing protein [Acidobacteriota bacterium]
MTAKEQALKQITDIARSHDLSASEILAELSPGIEATPDGKSSILTRLFAYLGGIFVLAGLGIFITMQWDDMNSIARITVTLGSGIAAFVMALFASADERAEKAATPLFLVAALLQPTGILVALDEFSTGSDERYAFLLTSGVLLIQQALIFLKTRRTALLFMTLIFGTWLYGTAMDMLDLDEDLIVFSLGLSVFFVSYSIDKTRHAAIAPFWYFVSSSAMLAALFSLIKHSILEILFLGAACGVVFLSAWVKSRGLLAVGTVAILGYVGYYTSENFSDVVGWPIALMLFGLLLIGLSTVAFRIDRKYIATK